MDIAWCRERLQQYLDAVEAHISGKLNYGGPDWQKIQRRRPTARAILNALDPGDGSLILEDNHSYNVQKGIVLRGLGVLEDREDLSVKLAPDAPRLSADRLHLWAWEPAKPMWEIRQFRQALLAAATSINAHVQAKVGRRDIADDKLYQECFSSSDPKPGSPRLRVPGDLGDQTVQSRQRGALQMALGCVWMIRNPAAHLASHDAGELDEQVAFEQLATLSNLARLVDECVVQHEAGGETEPAAES